jgi:hypothetical protein
LVEGYAGACMTWGTERKKTWQMIIIVKRNIEI